MSTMAAMPYDAAAYGPVHPHARQSFTWPTAMDSSHMGTGSASSTGNHQHQPLHHHHQQQQHHHQQQQQQHHHQHHQHELPPLPPTTASLAESHMGSETSSARSMTNSPPRSAFSPDRYVKRQMDHARRESKISIRSRRTISHPYAPHSPPLTLADTSSAMHHMTLYQTAPPPMTAPMTAPMTMGESSGPISSQAPYMQPYSPPLTEPTQYTPTFSPPIQQHGYAMAHVNYDNVPYSAPGSYERANTMSDMFQLPPSIPPQTPSLHDDAHVRVVQTRPKPQCWEHGCNGRQFSTFSNFLRHQREKSGQATKSVCEYCGQCFTRSTARNGHVTGGKCRGFKGDNGEIPTPPFAEIPSPPLAEVPSPPMGEDSLGEGLSGDAFTKQDPQVTDPNDSSTMSSPDLS